MIRHVVGWKFASPDAAAQDAAFAEVKQALEALVGVVPGLIDLTVVRSIPTTMESDSELGLVSHHGTVDDLRVYAQHPDHLVASAITKSHTRDRWALDYEV